MCTLNEFIATNCIGFVLILFVLFLSFIHIHICSCIDTVLLYIVVIITKIRETLFRMWSSKRYDPKSKRQHESKGGTVKTLFTIWICCVCVCVLHIFRYLCISIHSLTHSNGVPTFLRLFVAKIHHLHRQNTHNSYWQPSSK